MSIFLKEFNKTLNKQAWLDRYAEPLQDAVRAAYRQAGSVGQKVADFLNGVWLGHPLHSVLTDIPLGSWTAAILLDTLAGEKRSPGLERGADAAVALGVAGAVGSAVTGITDWQHTEGETRRTGLLHAGLNTVALGFFIGSMVSRGSGNRKLGRDLAFAGYLITGASAFLGGDMVYRQKMGVNHAPGEVEARRFEAVMQEADLPENKLMRVMLKETPLVIYRKGKEVYALAESCAHLGGPLSEGNVDQDEQGQLVVVCPWHRSKFSLNDGHVVQGPATFPQPCFETRVRNGKIEVRRRIEDD